MDSYGAPALKRSCLLRHARGVVWRGEREGDKTVCLGGERGSEKISALKVISQQVCEHV